MKRAALLFTAYLVLAVVATWPLALQATSQVYGGTDTPQLNIWAIGVVLRQLGRDPLRIFDGNAFYPYHETLAFSEHLFAPALLAGPVAWTTGNLVLAHNVVALVTLALAGLGAFLLAHELTGHSWGSAFSGILYALHTWNINELVRLQIISNAWFPFLGLALLRYFRRPTGRHLGLVVVFFLLQSLSGMYWLLYMPLLLLPLVAFLTWRERPSRRSLAALALAGAVAVLVLVPFVLPYVSSARSFGFARDTPLSLDTRRYVQVLPGNHLYAGLLGSARTNENAAHFLGWSALALAGIGVVRGRFDRDPAGWRGFLGGLAVAGFLLSLGPSITWAGDALAPGPYQALSRWVPGFQNVRYPERLSIFLVLALVPLTAAGLASLCRFGSRVGPVACALLFLEHFAAPLPLSPLPTPGEAPAAYRWLAGRTDVTAVAEVPGDHYWLFRRDARAMFLSTLHWQRTVQGYTGYFPPIQNYVRWRVHHFPSDETLAFLEGFGVDTLIVHPEAVPSLGPAWSQRALHEIAPGDGQRILRLVRQNRLLGPPAALPGDLSEIDRRGWLLDATAPNATLAADGDPRTAWTTGVGQAPGDMLFVRLSRPTDVARLALTVSYPFEFPTRLRVRVRSRGEGWRTVPFDREAAYDEMFRKLLHTPREASLDVDLEARGIDALRLEVDSRDSFDMPWTVPELRLYARRVTAR